MADQNSAVAIYVHTPFCPTKCGYCDFNSYAMEGQIIPQTVEAICKEIDRSPYAGRPAKTIFFGGGTPTIIPAPDLERILDAVRNAHPPIEDCEVSIESNPGTADSANYPALRQSGFNRISVGAQSFSAFDLKRLGRVHSPEQVPRAIDTARRAGFENINIDLMFGLPHQTIEGWEQNLKIATSLNPEHLSLYALTIEPNTRFYKLFHKGVMHLPTDELFVEMLDMAIHTAAAHGYQRYEISNFAKPGFECRHNLEYWRAEEYVGYGPGAVGCVFNESAGERVRYTNIKHPTTYCEAFLKSQESTKWCESEVVNADTLRTEKIMLGLRLKDGIQTSGLNLSEQEIDKLLDRNWAIKENGSIRLTEQGMQFHNDAVLALV